MLHAQVGAELRADTPATVIKPTATAIGKNGGERVIHLNGPVTFFGSHREVQVRLKHHTIAPAHCAIINTGSSLILRDLASRSGTKLNGKATSCAKLSDGDTIRVAGWKFRVGFSLRSGSGCGGSSIAAARFDTTPGMSIESVETGKRWDDLPEIIVIGRRGACDIALDRDGVSRSHALICRLDGRTAIFDLKSANGVKVNGQPTSMTYLSSGDLIRIGGHELRLGDLRNAGDHGRKSGDSSSVFGGVADETIMLAHSESDLPGVGFMEVADAAPDLMGGSGLRAVPDRRDRLGMRFEQQAGELSALQDELAAREQDLVEQAAVLHEREVALDARITEFDERLRGEGDASRQHSAAKAKGAPTVSDLCDVEQKLASRKAVLDELSKSLDVRASELDVARRKVQAREPVLSALSKSLETRAEDLNAKHCAIMKTKSKFDAWRQELTERADELDARNQAISSQEEVLQRAADPLAVSDDRSYEILRLLDPVLGDSVRVLRRLGIGGSFDDLVERARCELSAGEREKKSRGRWNLFG